MSKIPTRWRDKSSTAVKMFFLLQKALFSKQNAFGHTHINCNADILILVSETPVSEFEIESDWIVGAIIMLSEALAFFPSK